MDNKIRINLSEGLELVAELYDHDGQHPEIIVFLEKDGIIHQDVCLVRPHENVEHVQEADRVDCIVWSDADNEDYTHKFVVGIYEED